MRFRFVPTSADLSVSEAVGKEPDPGKFPHAARWFRHVASYPAKARKSFAKAKSDGYVAGKAQEDDGEDDVDLVSQCGGWRALWDTAPTTCLPPIYFLVRVRQRGGGGRRGGEARPRGAPGCLRGEEVQEAGGYRKDQARRQDSWGRLT